MQDSDQESVTPSDTLEESIPGSPGTLDTFDAVTRGCKRVFRVDRPSAVVDRKGLATSDEPAAETLNRSGVEAEVESQRAIAMYREEVANRSCQQARLATTCMAEVWIGHRIADL